MSKAVIGKNIFSGFVVSLIALPLSLGLAMASGVPPLAGVIAAIVGGIIMYFFGGSNITITGPGNGMVVVTLSAVMTLGQGDMLQGYYYTLAAIMVSGLIIFLLGLFRFGALSDFFPSPAIQGMLAAIGIIILAKQLHLMLGEMSPQQTEPLALLMAMPETLGRAWQGEFHYLSWLIGLLCLLILFIYPHLHLRWLHLIPAPMLVVLLAVLINKMAGIYGGEYSALGSAYLLQIPENISAQMAFPDFSRALTADFALAVLAISFIATVESLLSIKAVDKLDPLRRISNVNKDLRALGMANFVSALLGGINVVSVIARSSVNVNNGATNKTANLFHALFIASYVFLFTAFLREIPLPALAAILVYTGYKLASPAVFRRISRVGPEQLLIFLITMLSTLYLGLIVGIIAGIVATLLLQMLIFRELKVIYRNIFRPNTLFYQEENDQYHLSVRAFSNFLNFLRIKRSLDSVPRDSQVIVDFSLSHFVDYSVLEQLEDYYQNFRKEGGKLDIIGLDDLNTPTEHPFAQRSKKKYRKKISPSLTHRQEHIEEYAERDEWQFDPREMEDFRGITHFQYFSTKVVDGGRNQLKKQVHGVNLHLADLDYHEGEFIARESLHLTVIYFRTPFEIPAFTLEREKLLDRVAHLTGFYDINFTDFPDFSHRYRLRGEDEAAIRAFFDRELLIFFEENPAYHLESHDNGILIFEKERLATISEIKQMASFANRLAEVLLKKK